MPAKRSGLGRGLDALLPKAERGIQQIPLGELSISSYQPRKRIDPEAIAELASSIAEKGILQPLLVRARETGFEIVAGERRFRAAEMAGLGSVPAIVRELSDQETLEIAIIENLQREDLNAVEEARAFQQLMSFGLNQEEVAKAVGKSRSSVANTLRLLRLPEAALAALETGSISAGHARAVLAQPEEDRKWALEQILGRNLSVRDAEGLTRKEAKGEVAKEKEFAALESDLSRFVGTKVKVSGHDRGKIELHFFSRDELQRLLDLMGYRP